MVRLLHLNGPPGIGKSTLARRYADDHPGVLCCDIDLLRTLVGGWRDDFVASGAAIRPAAQALVTAYLGSGRDVVLPQLILREEELRRFETAAARAHAQYVHVVLTDDRAASVARFGRRDDAEAWHPAVRRVVADQGGDDHLGECHDRLTALAARRGATLVRTTHGAEDAAYAAVLEAFSGD